MAVNLGFNSTRRSTMRRSRGGSAEMNLTPLIDVMVVLLIIFMISAPLMTVTVPVDLPTVDQGAMADGDDPLVITIDKTNTIYLNDTKIGASELIPRLQAITGQKPAQRIFIRGDHNLSYGTIMQVMGQLTGAGFTKVALVAETGK